jgi:hypothetical protein
MYLEGAVVVPDRDQASLSTREVRSLLMVTTSGGLEPGIAVAA